MTAGGCRGDSVVSSDILNDKASNFENERGENGQEAEDLE